MKCTKCEKQINFCLCKTKCVEWSDTNPVKIHISTPIPNLIMKYSGIKTLDVFGRSVSY